jgi:hypothetical protein
MRKITNDPSKYLKRSDLYPRSKDGTGDKSHSPKNREISFLTARIDARGYIDFRPIKAKRSGRH